MQTYITRRDFGIYVLIGGTATALNIALDRLFSSGYSHATPAGTTIGSVATVPDYVKPVNIEQIVNVLASDITAGQGSYVSDFIHLVNSVHHEQTGMTFPVHMRERYQGKNKNPIDVVVLKGLKSKDESEGFFIHESEPGRRNVAYVDADLNPKDFLRVLGHELIHGVYGPGEVRAWGHGFRDIAFMIARYPELLVENGSDGLLSSVLRYYIGDIGDNTPLYTRDYITFLGLEKLSLDKAASILEGKGLSWDDHYRILQAMYWPLSKTRFIEHFLSETERYMLAKTPTIPSNKKALLRAKLDGIKAVFR